MNPDSSLNASYCADYKVMPKKWLLRNNNECCSEKGSHILEVENNGGKAGEESERISITFGVPRPATNMPHGAPDISRPVIRYSNVLPSRKRSSVAKALTVSEEGIKTAWPTASKSLLTSLRFTSVTVGSPTSNNQVGTSVPETSQTTAETSRKSGLSTSPKSTSRSKKLATSEPPMTRTNKTSAPAIQREKETLNGDKETRLNLPCKRRVRSHSSPLCSECSRIPRRVFGSLNLTLDRNKHAKRSVLTHTNKKPSSQNSNAKRSDVELGMLVRLNKTFHLRLLKLETDQGGQKGIKFLANTQNAKKKSSKDSTSKSMVFQVGEKTTISLNPVAKPFVGKSVVTSENSRFSVYEKKRDVQGLSGKVVPGYIIELHVSADDDDMMSSTNSAVPGHTLYRFVLSNVMAFTRIPLTVSLFREKFSFWSNAMDISITAENQADSIAHKDQWETHQCKQLVPVGCREIALWPLAHLWSHSRALPVKESEKSKIERDSLVARENFRPGASFSGLPSSLELTEDLSRILENWKWYDWRQKSFSSLFGLNIF